MEIIDILMGIAYLVFALVFLWAVIDPTEAKKEEKCI